MASLHPSLANHPSVQESCGSKGFVRASRSLGHDRFFIYYSLVIIGLPEISCIALDELFKCFAAARDFSWDYELKSQPSACPTPYQLWKWVILSFNGNQKVLLVPSSWRWADTMETTNGNGGYRNRIVKSLGDHGNQRKDVCYCFCFLVNGSGSLSCN